MKKQVIKALAACALPLTMGVSNVHAQLVNGGFEAGLASWGTSGFVLEGYDYGIGGIVHQGTRAFYGGGIENPGYLFQTIPTTSGQDYRVSFWVQSDGYVPNQITLRLNGVTMYSASDLLLQGFQQVQVDFRASGPTTELRFGLRNDSGFLRLDDIGVSPVPEPAAALLLTLGIAAIALRRRAQIWPSTQRRPNMEQATLVRALAIAGVLSTPIAVLAQADASLIAARQKVFGIENVDATTGAVKKDKVVFSWLGHNAGAVSLLGRVVMVDTYIPRLEVTPGRTPFVIKDLVDLKPEALFIGHGHSDHADNAAFIAVKTGATLYMTPEACGTAITALTRMKNDTFMQADAFYAIPQKATINCVGITSAGSVPGTQVIRIPQLEPLVCINGFRAMHSVSVATDPDWGPQPVVDSSDPRDATLFPVGVPLTPTNPRQLGQQDLRQGAGPGGADQLDFQFTLRGGYNFTFLYNNSVGAFKEGKGSNWPDGVPADGQRLLNLMRSLPNTDLNFSSLSSGNTDNNGWRDHVYHAEALRPKIMTSGHAPVGGASIQYYSGFLNHLKLMEQPKNAWPGFPRSAWPIVRNHTDPMDILRPEVYSPGDPAWYHPQKAARVAQFCS